MTELSSFLRFHINVFEAIGFASKPNEGRWLPRWSGLLFVVYNVAAYTALFSNGEFLFTHDLFGYFNDILKVVFGIVAISCCYLESLMKRSDLKQFWKCYDELQTTIPIYHHRPKKRSTQWRKEFLKNRRFLLTFYSILGCEITVAIVFFSIKEMTHHLILFWGVFTPFIFATHMRNMQFIFFIELIRLELVKLKEELHLMVDYSRFQAYGTGFKGFEEFLRSKIVEKQKEYQLIYEMYERFQGAFGISIVTVLLMIYVRVVVDSYFNYYMVYRSWQNSEIIMLVPACLHIPIFLIFSKNCMDVVQYISLNLHCIISQFDDHNAIITIQVQNFSLQLLHQQININGIGITRMDGYMVARAVGSITTYMIFFIQFMPKFSNVST